MKDSTTIIQEAAEALCSDLQVRARMQYGGAMPYIVRVLQQHIGPHLQPQAVNADLLAACEATVAHYDAALQMREDSTLDVHIPECVVLCSAAIAKAVPHA